MSNQFTIEAQSRDQMGKSHARRMRNNNVVPAVVYGGEKGPQAISIQHNIIERALQNEAVFSHILDLKINDNAEKVVIKDVQRHPYKPKIAHVDFFRVSATEKLTMMVPLHFLGEEECPGVKEGGVVSHLITELEIKCLPQDLPEYIELDISNLALDEAIHISEIKLPQAVSLAHPITDEEHDQAVVSVHMPRMAKEDLEEEAVAEESAETTEEAEGTADTDATKDEASE